MSQNLLVLHFGNKKGEAEASPSMMARNESVLEGVVQSR